MASTSLNDSLGVGDTSAAQIPDATSRTHENSIYQIQDHDGAQNVSASSEDYLSLVARATNDAVRDLDLARNRITWPFGLRDLFGYDAKSTSTDAEFWTAC